MERKDIKGAPYETYQLNDGRIVRTYWVLHEGYLSKNSYHFVNDDLISLSEKYELIKGAQLIRRLSEEE